MPVNALWMTIGAVVVAWLSALVWSRYRTPQADALGSVSEQWLAEHRIDRSESQR